MTWDCKVTQIELQSGTTINNPSGIVAFIGPNNSGKSRTIKEIARHLRQSQDQQYLCVKDVQIAWPQTADEIIDVLRTTANVRDQPESVTSPKSVNISGFTGSEQHSLSGLTLAGAQVALDNGHRNHLLRQVGPFLVSELQTNDRLYLGNVQGTTNALHPPQSYLQALLLDQAASQKLDELVWQAFGQHIRPTAHRLTQVMLKIGDSFEGEPGNPADNIQWLENFSSVDDEGDGIRSFVAVCLALLVGRRPFLVLDEPEAFLHPPQARLLGRFIGQEVSCARRQVILATHSSDLLLGILEEYPSTTLVRLSRSPDFAAKVVPADVAGEIQRDPVLAASDVLDGLFHAGAVVVEGDSDRSFYSRLLAQLTLRADVTTITALNKQTVPRLLRLYRHLGLPAAGIVDFDILRDESDLVRICAMADADAETVRHIKELRTQVRSAVENIPVTEQVTMLHSQLTTLLSTVQSVQTDTEMEHIAARLRELVKRLGRWAVPKEKGLLGLPQAVRPQATELCNALAALGVFVIPVGQLESWPLPGVTAKDKRRWLSEALTVLTDTGPDTGLLSPFLRAVMARCPGQPTESARLYEEVLRVTQNEGIQSSE